jgi:hypothetical protein
MKRLILLLASVTVMGASSFAQMACSKNHQIFKFDNPSTPTAVRVLGQNPQFPALRGKASSEQIAASLKKQSSSELNRMLMEIGFANGVKSVKASNVSEASIAMGTTGNMGDGNNNYHYIRVAADKGFKAWKITSDDGCFVYVLAHCGNTFFPGAYVAAAMAPQCKDINVTVTGQAKDISVADNRNIVRERTYVYFKKGCSGKTSEPLLINSRDIPEQSTTTYRVTPGGTSTVRVCTDATGNNSMVTTDLNVEKISGFSGFKRTDKKVYKLVSKQEYKKYLRSEGHCSGSCK